MAVAALTDLLHAAHRWLLPDGVNDILPDEAERLERLRRQLLDLLAGYGYRLVMPPFLEYTSSLLADASPDLADSTFKLVDPQSGRLMGIRADMTPQVARIDAHVCRTDTPARYAYAATVFHAQPQGLRQSRTPMQLGAELYGVADSSADREIIDLMLAVLTTAGLDAKLHLDLGHVGIFWRLSQLAGLSDTQEDRLFDIYQRKSLPDLREYLSQQQATSLHPALADAFYLLGQYDRAPQQLRGHFEQLPETLRQQPAYALLMQATDELINMAQQLRQAYPKIAVGIDVTELRGYHYHTGLVFTAYAADLAMPIAQGGRYDEIGLAYGRGRAATGFSCDLQLLLSYVADAPAQATHWIGVDWQAVQQSVSLQQHVTALRAQGHRVIYLHADQPQPPHITHHLQPSSDAANWQLATLH